MKALRRLFIAVGLFLVLVLSFLVILLCLAWIYTTSQISIARSSGVYPSAEQAMRSKLDKVYKGISRVDVLYAGPNSFDGSQSHIWYVIAEVRATSRADGSSLGHQGCDAPGSFFLQTKQGWVHVPEGAFPEILGFLMNLFGIAGPGQSTPSIDWAPSQPNRFCQ